MRINAHVLGEWAAKSTDKRFRAGEWIVYEKYEIRTRDGERHVRAPRHDDGAKVQGWAYQPLVKYPDLFLRFARLADDGGLNIGKESESEMNVKAALEWSETYGVLGTTPAKARGAWWADPRGGVGDTVKGFVAEARIANDTLRLYEAATRPKGADVETVASFTPSRYKGLVSSSPATARDYGLMQVASTVHGQVARHRAHVCPYRRPVDGRFVEGYDFGSLLGAMWLQALWLLEDDRPGRCRTPWCARIIAFEQPELVDHGLKKNARGPHRTHANKDHCSKKCYDNYYYETVTKPHRQAASARR